MKTSASWQSVDQYISPPTVPNFEWLKCFHQKEANGGSWSIAVARRASIGARFLPHCRPSMLVTRHCENKLAESEGASRMGMDRGALASIVLGTHASVFVKRRAAIKRAS